MTKLYTDFATLYHRTYPSFIDYDEQYRFYSDLLQKYGCRSVLEVGLLRGDDQTFLTYGQRTYGFGAFGPTSL